MKPLSIESIAAGEYRAEYTVSLAASPFLADHRFQEMVVVPGSFLVGIAADLHQRLFSRAVERISKIQFLSPLILGEGEIRINVKVKEEAGRATFTFCQESTASHFAAMEIGAAAELSGEEHLALAEFLEKSGDRLTADQFYDELRARGNQYGPAFQKVAALWRREGEVLGRIVADDEVYETPPGLLSPTVLDSVTQLLSACSPKDCRSFLLRSIETVEFLGEDDPEFLWARCRQHDAGSGGQVRGDISLFDHQEKLWARLRGVAIERVECARERESLKVVVASNFTAEPVEDSLRFWADHFGMPVDVRFAPYNQVFQQLLDPQSALHKNTHGVNLILLSLDEWSDRSRRSHLHLDPERTKEILAAQKRYFLPNGLEIAHLNSYETDYVYGEIFEDECYLRHGIHLPDGATVIDIGANIGLFTLFVLDRCESPTIYAFEPAPATYQALKANCSSYGSEVRTFNLGVAGEKGHAPFTFYQNSSVFSGFHSDQKQDAEAIEAVVENVLNHASLGEEVTNDYVRELSAHRADSVTIECPLTTISDIIRENKIEKIDLLKIDAEKSELEILQGVQEDDWKKIGQVVMEIHDVSGARTEAIRTLLHGRGYHTAVEEEKLLKKSGLVNLYATREQATATVEERAMSDSRGDLDRNVTDFVEALEAWRRTSSASLVVCLCPPAQHQNRQISLDRVEQKLAGAISTLGNVSVIPSSTMLQQYAVSNFHDAFTHQAGHVPYTPEGYATIGTAAFRALTSLQRNPYKVIVLDCDNTLWQGVCGEDGATGVVITEGHRALQEFVLGQMRAGMLLCLCSKNEEQDVVAVLEGRDDMLIRREHLASYRINWQTKSRNIQSLAHELNLGLDSFIFIDDNPVECAEVKSSCPEVLTLQLPTDPGLYPSFLQSIWAFDRAASTAEDGNRTRMYQENAERERFREKTLSLGDFIEGLGLKIDIREAVEEDIPRISQLTFRTNQFNFTSVRRSEPEVRAFLQRPDTDCLVVNVADRFGDYGLVGVVMYEVKQHSLSIDTFLLSCRVLGRGVEHAIVRNLGQRACASGLASVKLRYVRTPKNTPALAFATSLGVLGTGETGSWTFAPEVLAQVEYNAQDQGSLLAEAVLEQTPNSTRSLKQLVNSSYNERVQEVGERFSDIDRVVAAIEKHRGEKLSEMAQSPTGGSLEATLGAIWKRVLGRSAIGKDENFFDAGGTSLKAVQLVALIRKEIHQTLPIAAVFEFPTLALMLQKLRSQQEPEIASEAAAAMRRGQQRRYRTMRNAG